MEDITKKIIPYYGNTMDFTFRELRTFANVTNTEGYGNSNNGQQNRENDNDEDRPGSGLLQERKCTERRSENFTGKKGGG